MSNSRTDESGVRAFEETDGFIPLRQAPAFLCMSEATFYRHVRWQVPVVKLGARLRGVNVADLRRWRDGRAEMPEPERAAKAAG